MMDSLIKFQITHGIYLLYFSFVDRFKPRFAEIRMVIM
jgi:hypothetical protein